MKVQCTCMTRWLHNIVSMNVEDVNKSMVLKVQISLFCSTNFAVQFLFGLPVEYFFFWKKNHSFLQTLVDVF